MLNEVEPPSKLDSEKFNEVYSLTKVNSSDIVINHKLIGVSISSNSLKRLIGEVPTKKLTVESYLNDEVMNSYLNLIQYRSSLSPKLPNIYCFSSFFFDALASGGFGKVSRWTRKSNIFKNEILFIPINLKGIKHWTIVAVDFIVREFIFFDSLPVKDPEKKLSQAQLHKIITIQLKRYFEKEIGNKKISVGFEISQFTQRLCQRPLQRNKIG